MKIYNFNFYTQYNQFFIEDKENKESKNAEDFWNEKAFEERLALGKGVVGVGTQSYGNIKGEIEILDNPNQNTDFSKYDHIVEGDIRIQSGELQILDCPNSDVELSLKVTPGNYRVRIYSSNLTTVKERDIPNETDKDYYHIELWRSNEIGRKVLKQSE